MEKIRKYHVAYIAMAAGSLLSLFMAYFTLTVSAMGLSDSVNATGMELLTLAGDKKMPVGSGVGPCIVLISIYIAVPLILNIVNAVLHYIQMTGNDSSVSITKILSIANVIILVTQIFGVSALYKAAIDSAATAYSISLGSLYSVSFTPHIGYILMLGLTVACLVLELRLGKIPAMNRGYGQQRQGRPMQQAGYGQPAANYRQQPNYYQNQAPQYVQNPGQGGIRMEGGEYAGTKISMKPGEKIVIGRDPAQCALVCQSANVSRVHLVIRFDPRGNASYGSYIVTDMSTNGTISSQSGRLQKGQSTRQPGGTLLTLGRSDETIRLL